MSDATYDEGQEVTVLLRPTAWVLGPGPNGSVEITVDGDPPNACRWVHPSQLNTPRLHELLTALAEVKRLRGLVAELEAAGTDMDRELTCRCDKVLSDLTGHTGECPRSAAERWRAVRDAEVVPTEPEEASDGK